LKGLDWENERYVRIYTRDTPDWVLLGWEAQAAYPLIMRKLDRAGVLELGKHDPPRAIAAVTRLPLELVERALPVLVGPGGPFELREGFLVDPDFLDAQEAKQSDAARQRAARERARLREGRTVRLRTRSNGTAPIRNRSNPSRIVTPPIRNRSNPSLLASLA
jgi:hypothetical protein